MSVFEFTLGPGQRIGSFVVDRLLGKGGSGEVYCVHDLERGPPVALKLLPRATIDRRPDIVPAFEREYHRLQLLRHPRIVEVYHYASDPHGLFYTMELIDGPDLRAVRPMPWRQTCFVLRDIALSLAIVHSRRLVHRDVGPGNVRLSRDGRAKLLDFGATVSMGIPCDVVGTPPCTPPEAFAYEPLDARADLFGLGALGYYLLTGEHAYPASTTSQLLSHWESPLTAPSTHTPEIPRALDQLIAALLQRDRRLRPRSATEVFNHLEAIADLPPVPAHEAAQTSFVAPALAGRSAELHLLCCQVAAARSGNGSTVLLEGAPGQGRTRLLRQLLIEASHPDVLMIEVSPQSGAMRRYDGCLELCEAVLRQSPELALHEATQQLSELRRSARGPQPAIVQHKQLLTTLREALLELTQRTTLVLLLDDMQDCDDASLALFASLAERASDKRLLLVATRQIGARVQAAQALQALAQHANRLLLKPLSPRAVETLVRSAFVDAQQVKFVSEWVASLSEGNPSKIVELLRHLVEHDLVVFRDGAWVLPEHIDPALLPRDVADALRGRVASLTSSARDLVQLLAVLVSPARLDDVRSLAQGEALRALDELSSADLIRVDANAMAAVRPVVREIVLQGADAEQMRRAHARVGSALAQRFAGDRYDASVDLPTAYLWAVSAYHLLLGGDKQRGVQLWLNALRYTYEVDYVALWDGNRWYTDANLLALAAARELGLPRSLLARLCISAVQSSPDPEPAVLAAGEDMLQELERASGLIDYAGLAQIADPLARIAAAMEAARERWSNLPKSQRSAAPDQACALLHALTLGLAFSYYHTLNASKVAALPQKLRPFVPLAPSCETFALLIEGVASYVAGRTQHELEQRCDALATLDSPAMRGFVTETMRHHLRGLWLYAIAAIEIVRDPQAGLARVVQIENETPFMTFGAWQLRLLAHIHECDPIEAQACAERLEIACVQDATVAKQVLHASGLQLLAAAYALAGDIVGLMSLIEKLDPFAQSVPSWRPFCDAARAHYHLLRGQAGLARELAEQAVAATEAGQHRGYGFAVLALLRVQIEQQDNAAAETTAGTALERARASRLGPELEAQLCALHALALARVGSRVAAQKLARQALSIASDAGFTGLMIGEIQRVLARAAILERDVALFEQHAAAVARHTCAHEHPVLLARYERLLSEAAEAGLLYSVERAGAATLEHNTDLRAQLLAELTRNSLARSLPERVLDLMVERAGASAGYLFMLEGDTLRASAPGDAEIPAGLSAALEACLAAERAVAAPGAQNTLTATRTSVIRLDDGQLFQVAVLHVVQEDGAMRAAGAIALSVRDALPAIPRWDCLLALSTVLHETPP